MWKIRNISIDNQIVIAPMAGISNPAFRSICKKFGAGLIYTEMVSDKAICYSNTKTIGMTQVNEDEHPLTMQLFGHDIESMVQAAVFIDTQTDCDILDINMGCPVNKIVKSDAGSALMKDPEHAAEIVREIVKHVQKPVTVKMRAGWDKDSVNAVEFALMMQDAGASALAVHGRTRKQMYEGKADWRIIKAVKDAVSIPVMGNGDVTSPQLAKQMLDETGVDAVMIGRGILGDPWLIRQTAHYLQTGELLGDSDIDEKFELARQHAQSLIVLKGENVGMKEMRGHASWYMKGLKYSHRVKDCISQMTTYEEFVIILENYKQSLINDEWKWLDR
ncbi:tRNA dihydrouridine synthase DusB [Dielma fastidiosa]|uniref:tRNA dihydrouridine synthase DusB n=1 Tax=Dielma fastidiosa TaxID=1034346 RepID=UPI000E46E405|nr:tRNA dihydrouridine synthase DusB [Dielma fastidiosa]RHN01634.1 tRNA dihydrouridine synthase DusB [Dielma fastidiosa]